VALGLDAEDGDDARGAGEPDRLVGGGHRGAMASRGTGRGSWGAGQARAGGAEHPRDESVFGLSAVVASRGSRPRTHKALHRLVMCP
jgi:hypothetical protein